MPPSPRSHHRERGHSAFGAGQGATYAGYATASVALRTVAFEASLSVSMHWTRRAWTKRATAFAWNQQRWAVGLPQHRHKPSQGPTEL